MAIKDPNVLNRINTLNTNLEKGDIAKVEENIWKMLFNVLEWSTSISVDSELYDSIDKATSASNIANYINTAKAKLSSTYVSIPYTWWAFNVPNSVTALAAGAPIANTETAITNMNNAIAWLNTLPGQINTLRNRLQENLNILNDAYNAQSDFEAGWYARRRSNEIQNDIHLCSELQGYLRTIDDAERYLSTHPWNVYYEGRRDNARIDFNNNRFAGIEEYNDYWADFGRISGQVRSALRWFNQERSLSEELIRNENRFNKTQCKVPWDLWLLFDANHTVITTPLVSAADIDTSRGHIRDWLNQLNVLEWQIETLRARYQENLNQLEKIKALQQLEQRMNVYPGERDRRHREFNTIREISNNNLLLWEWAPAPYEPYLPNTTIVVWERWVWWNPAREIHLDFVYWALWTWFNGWARTPTYSLCDGSWNPLRNNWWRLEIQQWWQTLNIRWITFDNAAQTMRINDLEVTPIEWLTFPLNLDLNVRVRIHDNDTWLDIDHHKPIHLEITRPTLVRANREAAYDSLVPPMDERIAAEYSDKYREGLEADAIWSILREWGNEVEVNEIYNNETRRAMFIDRVRTALAWNIPFVWLAALQAWFRNDMTREDRDVPVQYLLGVNQFQNYVRQSIPGNLKDYASTAIRDSANNNHRNDILQEFLNFQADIANSRVDNNDNLRALAQVPNDMQWPEWHPNNFIQRLTWHESAQNNYTKFFQWRQAELNNLSLETEDGTINYWVKVEVTWVNKIVATIDIDWKEEPEIIEAPSHDRLIRWILTRASTKDGEPLNKKLRCNMALAVLKAMVLMSPQRLNRQIPATNFVDNRWNIVSCDRVEAFLKWWNLRIRWWHIDGSRTRQNVTIFDEAQFKELHDVDMLEDWIHELSTQVNMIMNATAQEYHEATSAMLRNDGNRYVMRYNTAQRLRWWPIKRLWWRMVHGKTSNDFNFDTAVNEAWKAVNIKLDKWLFTVSWDFDGQHYEYKGRNLWSILRKRINRKRVFDGVELAMVAAVNELFIQKLRENHRVQTENFIVADVNNGKTWRTYVFDDAWNLSYLEMEDINLNPLGPGQTWRVDPDQVPAERIRCNEEEKREFMQNPLLAGRLQRAMRRRLALF